MSAGACRCQKRCPIPHGAGVTGGCERLDMDEENPSPLKNQQMLAIVESFLQPRNLHI